MTNPPADTAPGAVENTDRELWRERDGDYYADSIHVTEHGSIGIDCGGTVIVKPLREWHELATRTLATGEIVERLRKLAANIVDLNIPTTDSGTINEAATLIEQQAATIAERDERIERLLRQQGLEDPDADVRRTTLNRSKGS